MEKTLYIILCVLFGLDVYLFINISKLRKNLAEQKSQQKKALVDAGNALTDTIKVIFDNLKNQGYKIDKLNKKETEYQTRFHKIENDARRLAIEHDKILESKNIEGKKYERNSQKAS